MEGSSAALADERAPLLKRPKPGRTPLPKVQIAIVLFLQICEPICAYTISPYIRKLVRTFGITGDRRIEAVACLIESLYFMAEAVTILCWVRLSDFIGRKPVILLGSVGLIMSMSSLGLSRAISVLILSRIACGLFAGNIGVIKSMMVELTDGSNRPDIFWIIRPVSTLGSIVGSYIGSELALPSTKYPVAFQWRFWSRFPYFYPCTVASAFVFGSALVTAFFFEETLGRRWSILDAIRNFYKFEVGRPLQTRYPNTDVRLENLLTFPVVVSIANYATLVFFNILLHSALNLVCVMPMDFGGFGLNPDIFALMRVLYITCTGVFQFLYFPRLVRTYGTRLLFTLSMATIVPVLLLLPCAYILPRTYGFLPGIWISTATMFFLLLLTDIAHGCILIHIIDCAPSKGSIRYVNGLAQTAASVVKASGPTLSLSLSRFALQNELTWGCGIYAVLAALALYLPIQLPRPPTSYGQTEDKAFT